MTTTHDYGPDQRYRGHDYIFEPIDAGLKGRMIGWGKGVKQGHYILLEQSESQDGRTRYRIDQIEYKLNPDDMWNAIVSFAPPGELP